MKKVSGGFLFLLAIMCVHAQAPVSSHDATFSWNAPVATASWTGCTTLAPCSYVVSTLKVSSTTTTCPASTGANYTPLNATAPTTSLSFKDTQDVGATVCAVVQTVQGVAMSAASAPTATPSTIPGNPVAPVLGQSTIQ
jgi:hypothetical protein